MHGRPISARLLLVTPAGLVSYYSVSPVLLLFYSPPLSAIHLLNTSTMLPLLISLLASPTFAVNNCLARTPQMGWNNWNSSSCDVSESLLLDIALKLSDSGLRDVRYKYVVLDDCWSAGRDAHGKIKVKFERFPSGIEGHSGQITSGMFRVRHVQQRRRNVVCAV